VYVWQVRDYPQFDPNVGMLNVEETQARGGRPALLS